MALTVALALSASVPALAKQTVPQDMTGKRERKMVQGPSAGVGSATTITDRTDGAGIRAIGVLWLAEAIAFAVVGAATIVPRFIAL